MGELTDALVERVTGVMADLATRGVCGSIYTQVCSVHGYPATLCVVLLASLMLGLDCALPHDAIGRVTLDLIVRLFLYCARPADDGLRGGNQWVADI